ncbi:nucleotidyltransferase family protein [Zunongwangia sp. F363]|uniref:Nucleotidyltransferase family protein n=1 Tax=Autumnicola tepida TaxID=3075595 RepID=A0ABU3C8S6_9FLAO|nr:nucleotidyltransferase family protein [Zunongwangia sp. F363]MDT0642673.1 nucleotidyltransferase family protein [Zunongwangia sp. F363]
MSKASIIIVAAGASRRMNKAKQLLPLEDGILLGKVIEEAKASAAAEVIIVLGAYSEEIVSKIQNYDCIVVKNENWQQGLGSSIAAGIRYFLQHKEKISAALVMLGDQPLVDSGYVDKMLKHAGENPSTIIATSYPRSLGVPAVFPQNYFKELANLKEDKGAKNILRRERDSVIALNAGERILDIDTPQDYQNLLDRYSK